ncbi:integrase, partial [Salmonella enterica subsp. enterica serovar Typhimurium]
FHHPVTQKRPKTTLGPYPVAPLAMSRVIRTNYSRLLYPCIDPRQHIAGIPEENRIQNECTLEQVAEQWLTEKKRTSDLS